MEDPVDHNAPSPPRHPVQAFTRGVGNVGLFLLEAAAAALELFVPPRGEGAPRPPRRSKKPHPVEKSAPFPIND
ncbi:MAG: hypothetical protein ACXWKN_11340 [Phenylobacterium sp.]